MNLPDIIRTWATVLNERDSRAFSKCFSEKAVVYDQHKVYAGRKAIKGWIEAYCQQYTPEIRPLAFASHGTSMVLSAELSGAFPQSPRLLKYYFLVAHGLIASLKISHQ